MSLKFYRQFLGKIQSFVTSFLTYPCLHKQNGKHWQAPFISSGFMLPQVGCSTVHEHNSANSFSPHFPEKKKNTLLRRKTIIGSRR